MKITLLNLIIFSAYFAASASASGLRHRELLTVEVPEAPISGEYIVELVANYNAKNKAVGLLNGMINKNDKTKPEIVAIFDYAMNGFAIKNFPSSKLNGFLNNPNVKAVYQNGAVVASVTQTQSGPTWGLDRINNTTGLDKSYKYNFTGVGVDIFILDTPANNIAAEFGSRFGTCTSFTTEACTTVAATNNHGTHVMGTAGGSIYGVAKGATMHSVRVLSNAGSGSNTGVIAGINHVISYKVNNPASKVVANLSLGGGKSTAVNNAVANAVLNKVVMVVAAGNENADACTKSPASATSAITVGAVTNKDARASYSNYGSCVDIFAPGSSIQSRAANGSILTISGTSMASPHVAGVAALYLEAGKDPNLIMSDATAGKLTSLGSKSPNKMLYTGFV